MSCPHGNHPDACDICDEVAAAYNSGVEAERQRREWVGLTHQQTKDCVRAWDRNDAYALARAIEAKLKEKNA